MKRRNLIKGALAGGIAASTTGRTLLAAACLAARDGSARSPAFEDSWRQGDLVHLLPLVNDRQMLIKASFASPRMSPPHLHVDGRHIPGVKSDSRGRFWQFHVAPLQPDRCYELQLQDRAGEALTDPWPLKTFPAPDAPVELLRILAYTCAGGNEAMGLADGTAAFLPLMIRQRLLKRGLSFSPDVVIANGDHIYWDQATSQNKPAAFAEPARRLFEEYGLLDRGKPALHADNETILTAIADPQIAQLYGVHLRSVPVYMLTDDHDLFENDEASDELITLPPDHHMLDVARSTQHLYYPEFLPDSTRSPWLAGSSAADRAGGVSEVYGTLRYGKLLEILLYDTKRYCTIKGPSATVIPPETERWLRERTASDETDHLMHIPSTPLGWSAGKWAGSVSSLEALVLL